MFTVNKIINKVKRSPTEWNNIFANDTACKGISIHPKLNSTPEKQTDKKWVEDRLPWWSSGEESACQCRDTGLIPGSERSHRRWSS